MCLAQIGRVLRVQGDGAEAVLDVGGVERTVALAVLVLEGATVDPGDWLVVHTGLAVEVLDPAAAAETLALRRKLGVPGAGAGP